MRPIMIKIVLKLLLNHLTKNYQQATPAFCTVVLFGVVLIQAILKPEVLERSVMGEM